VLKADTVLGKDDVDAGKSFSQILLEKKTKGNMVDPFCYDHIRESFIASADLGHYAFPLNHGICKLELLKKEKWLDYRTKQVMLQVLLYNGNVDIYTRIRVTFDFTLGGRIRKWVSVDSLEIRDMYQSTSDYIRLGFECAFVLLLLWNWRNIVDDISAVGGRNYCRRPNNLINIVGQIMYCFNIALWVIICFRMQVRLVCVGGPPLCCSTLLYS
jgi:hypothetical protein